MSGESSQPEYVGREGQPAGESSHSSWRPHGRMWISANELLSCSAPRPLVCQERYTVSAPRRRTLTAKPPPGGASIAAPNGLCDEEYHCIRLPTFRR